MGRTRPTRELEHDLLKLAFCEFQVFGTLKLILLLAGIWYLLVSSQILYLSRALQMLYLSRALQMLYLWSRNQGGGTLTLIVAYPLQYHPFFGNSPELYLKHTSLELFKCGICPELFKCCICDSGRGGGTLTLPPSKIDFKYRIWRFPDKCSYLVLLEILQSSILNTLLQRSSNSVCAILNLGGGPLTLIVSFSKVLLNLLPYKKIIWYLITKLGEGNAHPINEQSKDDFDTLFRQHNFTRTRVHSN